MSFTVNINSDVFDQSTLKIHLAKSMIDLIYTSLTNKEGIVANLEVTNTIYAASMFLEESYNMLTS